ncbi:Hypothetical Protein FCC1311_088632 [Hondaea fermentalgiana]|uniref:FZ domain-containing protein n=1 Tax=Hondaea fermentalgiana TaxID=2315210 RepID=A0A2R5GSA3_9STRA|nr:Hypothetical Protein FCC1311_088632 [Hondaea fermentalgiana]|eukprot:GBG32638.1 Hypothetical Protein FCC1311_088632 [Hondaea fermentalgiana]
MKALLLLGGLVSLANELRSARAAPAAPEQTAHEWGSCRRRQTGLACDDVLDVDFVWVYDGMSQAEQVADIADGLESVRNATRDEPDEHCRKRWKQRLCLTALPPCYINNEAGVEAPQRLCESECDTIWDACSRAFKHLKNDAKAHRVVNCDAVIGNEATGHSYLTRNYLAQWQGENVFVDWDTSVTDPTSGETFASPCWGKRAEEEEIYSDEDYFWNDKYLDNDDFRARCEAKGGEYVLRDGDAYSSESPECIFPTRESCERNGGVWEPVDRTEDGKVIFECYLPYLEDTYSYEENDPDVERWGAPTVTIDSGATEVTPGVWSVPFEMQLRCDAACDILVAHASAASDACDKSCAEDPTPANYHAGLVDLVPNGKWLSFVRQGRHIVRLRTVGRGKAPSAELVLDFSVVDEEVLPPSDSDIVYLRTKVLLNIGNVDSFDVYLFRVAFVEVLNADLDLDFGVPNVRVLELEETSVHTEIRTTTANQSAIEARLLDPLFVYPLAQALFNAGLINASDSCAAVAFVSIDGGSLKELRGLTTATSTTLDAKIIAVIACVLGIAVLGAGFVIRRRMKHLRAREAELDVQKEAVDRKAASLDAREQELAAKVKEMEAQEKELLSEKERLDQERESLEKEAEDAAKEVEAVEKEELRDLDPEAAEALEADEAAFHEELASGSREELEAVQKSFQDKMPIEDLEAGAERFLAAVTPVTAARRVHDAPQRLDEGQEVGDVAQLKAFRNQLQDEIDAEAFLHFVDGLVAKGALRDVAEDPRERIKQEYTASLNNLQNSIVDRREHHRAKLAERRKHRIAMVIEDAKSNTDLSDLDGDGHAAAAAAATAATAANGAATTNELVAEVLAGVERDFEAELASLRAEAPSQGEYETALARLEEKKRTDRAAKLKTLEQRRVKVRQRLQQTEAKMERERAAAEARQREVASKVANVFNKIITVEHKVNRLKEDHHSAQQQLKEELAAQKDRQRQKLLARKSRKNAKKAATKVNPVEAL